MASPRLAALALRSRIVLACADGAGNTQVAEVPGVSRATVAKRRRQHAALAGGARTVTILAPPLADPAGGEALWGYLTGLLRPPLARWWHGQPHIGFEYARAGPVMTIRMWVPGTVPPGMIERAVEAAWPPGSTPSCRSSPGRSPGPGSCGRSLTATACLAANARDLSTR